MNVDTRPRCPWVDLSKPDYVAYHDEEWGVPVHDDRQMFELIILEGAQAGLSWYTVLRKRARYREVFAGFDIARVAACDDDDVARWMQDPGLVRNRQKLTATIVNARAALAVQRDHGSLCSFLWSFADEQASGAAPRTLADYPARTAQSDALSKALEQRGFKFVGSTIVYALMQAAGLVNDHAAACFRREAVQRAHGPGKKKGA
ncbi:MAG: DNA-3-methyladenine glycosylase I [Gammaproteobacteria bacterium]|nr:DNA-3-methyladenine glycosylase I [Gammaproteobacteria bacterium]